MVNQILGIVLSNLSFSIGLLGAGQKNIQIVRILGAIDYLILGTWTYLYVPHFQAIPVVAWCSAYVVVYLFRFFIDLIRQNKLSSITETDKQISC